MDIEKVRKIYLELKRSNEETNEKNYNFVKRPIPHQFKSISFMAYHNVVGSKKLDSFISEVNEVCWNTEIQLRRIFAIVQAYGCGKTKLGLMLTKEYIVLPWRSLSTSKLNVWLQREQKQMLDNINQPTLLDIELFTFKCLAHVAAILHGHIALFRACVKEGVLDENIFLDRFYFALMFLNPDQCLTDWIIAWASNFLQSIKDEENIDLTLFKGIEELAGARKVVFLMDEVHNMINLCRGYCLHRTISPSDKDRVGSWYKEQSGEPCPDKAHCTDLFYQLRCFMLTSLQLTCAPYGFIMCSTVFRTWEHFEVDESPFSRGLIKKYFNLHSFNAEEVFNLILEFFNINISIDDPDIVNICSYFVRPLYVAEFMEELFKTIKHFEPSKDKLWLRTAFENVKRDCYDRARSQIIKLKNKDQLSQNVINILFAVQRLCGGMYQLAEGAIITNIIAQGVAVIQENSTKFRLADPVFVDALNDVCSNTNGALLTLYSELLNLSNLLNSHDYSGKGFMVERALCCVILESNLSFPTTAKCSGTIKELLYGKTKTELELLVDIALGKEALILIPSFSAGPDIWYCTTLNRENAVVAIQSKCEQKPQNLQHFKHALDSLNPVKMFMLSRENNTASKQNLEWIELLKNKLCLKKYFRCVFSAAGFTDDVYFLVSEYNIKYSDTRIILYNLDDLKEEFRSMYNALECQIKDIKKQNILTISNQAWTKLTSSQKLKTKREALVSYCRERGIPCSGNGRKFNKDKLVKSINDFNLDKELDDLKPQLE